MEPIEIEDNAQDFDEIVDKWRSVNKANNTEGESGVSKLEDFVIALDENYNDRYSRSGLHAFLADNPGCVQAIWEWVENEGERIPQWAENLKADLAKDED